MTIKGQREKISEEYIDLGKDFFDRSSWRKRWRSERSERREMSGIDLHHRIVRAEGKGSEGGGSWEWGRGVNAERWSEAAAW